MRGHVYLGGQALAVQEENAVSWVHEDPVTKTKKRTDSAGAVTSTTVVDPWGGEVTGAWVLNAQQQRRKFTTYERDASSRDEAQQRSYSAWLSRFDQPDPYDGSYDLTDPQSFNRYAYVQNDPVNFVDPSGLNMSSGGVGPCFLVVRGTHWDYPDGTRVTVVNSKSMHCFGGGGYAGGGTDKGASEQDPARQDEFKDCADFVNYLVSLASRLKFPASSGTRHQTPKQQAASKLGIRMMAEAFDYKYIGSSVEGFKRELTRYGQNAGVYGHVLLQAGGFLESWGLGALESAAFRLSDHVQRHFSPDPNRNAEALSEIAGNAAGRRVGEHMRNFIYGTTPREEQRLRNSLTSELCQ